MRLCECLHRSPNASRKHMYQLPLTLTALLHVAWETLAIVQYVPLPGHDNVALFEWRWIDTKVDNYVIIASLKSKAMGKQINRVPGTRLLISSLPDSASRTHAKSLCKSGNLTSILEALPGKLDIKRHSPNNLYLFPRKPIAKLDTHLNRTDQHTRL